MTFKELGINELIIKALADNKIVEPTDIQLQAIPEILTNTGDIVAVAQTGTGKTAAFCLPLLQTIDYALPAIQALVLVPTRELGQQVAREFFLFSKYLPRVFAEAVYGGASIDDQIHKLKRPTHVVVATRGRLIDLLKREAINLNQIKTIVLDEADEMLNMGFKEEIMDILAACKDNARKLLFTATMPYDVTHLIKDYLQTDYTTIRIHADELVQSNIKNNYIVYEDHQKLAYLKAFLNEHKTQRGILFCRTKIAAKRLAKQLVGFEVVADALHGNMNQEAREKVMRGFKKQRINLLIATDIAARGIDVKDLDYIIHYHLPEKAEQYTHRSGRTARAGKTGSSICFVKQNESNEITALEEKLNIQFTELSVHVIPEIISHEMITIYMNMGSMQGFTPRSIVEYLVEETGISDRDIDNVQVDEESLQFDIPQRFQQQVFLNLKSVKLYQRNLKLTLENIGWK